MFRFLTNIISALFGHTRGIAGHWRRLDFPQKPYSPPNQHQYGDLIIGKDSTYTFVGDEEAQRSEIPGWNTGETRKGRWARHGRDYIDLYTDDSRLPLVYKIRKLTRKELHLGSKNNDFPAMRYKRMD